MLERFLLCTGSLNGVLLLTDAERGKTGVIFFFFRDVILFSSFQHGVVFPCPWEVSHSVFLYLVF